MFIDLFTIQLTNKITESAAIIDVVAPSSPNTGILNIEKIPQSIIAINSIKLYMGLVFILIFINRIP